MQLKSRYVLTALAVLVVMTMATAAMAQVTLQVSSTPTARARTHGHAELIGDVTFTVLDAGGAGVMPVAGTHTLTVTYGIPIVNDDEDGVGSSIEVIGTGCFAGVVTMDGKFLPAPDAATDEDVSFNFAAGVVSLNLQDITTCNAGDFVAIVNVHASVVDLPNALYKAQVSTSPTGGYLIPSGGDQPTVITTILDELDGGVDTNGECLFLSDGVNVSNTTELEITENFLDAILAADQLGGGALNDVRVRVSFSGIPDGGEIVVDAGDVTIDPGSVPGPVNLDPLVADSDSPFFDIVFDDVGRPDPIDIDTLTVALFVDMSGADEPLPGGTITATVDIVPLGTAAKIVPDEGNFPRFQSDPEPEVDVCTIVPAQTTLLVPFMTAGGGFDTGIAVANTTSDNFGDNGAVPQDGAILFEFWPQAEDGTPFTYTTSAASPGIGLTDGVLESGGSYSVLLSEILADAGADAAFTGYMFVTTEFTNGHGDVFISDFSGFTSSGNMLVLEPPVAGNSRDTNFESLSK
jgi:hypothetical protein